MRISCLKCIHYHSTYDPYSPRGCKKFKFKSKRFPSDLIKEETGEDCHYFETKDAKKDSFNYHDPKNW